MIEDPDWFGAGTGTGIGTDIDIKARLSCSSCWIAASSFSVICTLPLLDEDGQVGATTSPLEAAKLLFITLVTLSFLIYA
jgi:hypothetical protein